MKALVTGAKGQLGHDLIEELQRRHIDYIGTDIHEIDEPNYVALDLCNQEKVFHIVSQIQPDIIFHCAAWTAVDLAEEEVDKCMAINYDATRYLCDACKAVDATMIYMSTDYVFNGEGIEPWQEDCEKFEPCNVYGKSKLLGEMAVKQTLTKYYIARIAWVFGSHGNNFVKTMLRIGRTHDKVRVVCDQIGTPTYTYDLARLLVDMSLTDHYGTYHITNEGDYISWYDFTCEIYKQAGLQTKVIPVSTIEYGLSKARRPHNSRLSREKLISQGFTPLPDWKDALKRYLEIQKKL